jgi:Flp pilus assembly protein TadG
MKKLLNFIWDCTAVELAEFAVVVPLLMTIIFGIYSFGRAYNIYSTITRAAQDGARVAVTPACAYCGYACGATSSQFPCDADIVNAVSGALAASHLDPTRTSQLVPTTSAVACPAPAPAKTCGAATGANGTTVYICRNVLINPSTTPQTCGTLVSFQYSYQFLPILFAPKISINIPAQGQMRMEY